MVEAEEDEREWGISGEQIEIAIEMVREENPLQETPLHITFPYVGKFVEKCYYKCCSRCIASDADSENHSKHFINWWEEAVEETPDVVPPTERSVE